MRNTMRATLAALIVLATVGALVSGVGYGTASAGGEDRIEGDGTFALATFDFNAHSTGDSDYDVSGYFEAEATSPADAFVAPQGKITCLSVDGNKAGFLYPVEDGKPEVLRGQYILITLEDGGEDGTDHIGFTGPAPEALFPNCHPGAAPFEVTEGDVEVHDEG